MKTCTKCRAEKPLAEFYPHKRDGYFSWCKNCCKEHQLKLNRKEYLKSYHEKNKETLSQKQKGYNEKNKDKIKQAKHNAYLQKKEKDPQYCSKQYQKNKGVIKLRVKQWCLENQEKVKQYHREYGINNKERIKKRRRGYWNRCPVEVKEKRDNYLKQYSKTANRKLVSSKHRIKRKYQLRFTDITAEWLNKLFEKTKTCELCSMQLSNKGSQYPNGKQLDHTLPLNAGGTHTKNNVRFICMKCNLERPKDGSDLLTLFKNNNEENINIAVSNS